MTLAPYDELVSEAVAAPFLGWNDAELNDVLGAPPVDLCPAPTLATARRLRWRSRDSRSSRQSRSGPSSIPWQIPDFDVDRYWPALRALDERIRTDGPFVAHDHRY